MKRIAIVLSGCGFRDGSEIHETVLTLLSVVRAGATPSFFAPTGPQASVVDHLSGVEVSSERSMVVEAARIARGDIKDLKELSTVNIDGIIFPGGSGAAKNLCDFAYHGSDCTVHPEVERVVLELHAAKKPQGFICIAPVIAARLLGPRGVRLTIGSDVSVASKIVAMGAEHVETQVGGACVDLKNKVISTPAYMLAKNVVECEGGIARLVEELMALCE